MLLATSVLALYVRVHKCVNVPVFCCFKVDV